MDFQDSLLHILQRIPWFNDLSPQSLVNLANISALRKLNAGENLFCEGDSENCLYILLEGEIELHTHAPGFGPIFIFRAEPLDILGWSVLTPVVRQRTDTARATMPSQLVCFNSEMLRQLCDDDPVMGYTIMKRIANVAASRLLTTRLHLFEVIRTQAAQSNPVPSSKSD